MFTWSIMASFCLEKGQLFYTLAFTQTPVRGADGALGWLNMAPGSSRLEGGKDACASSVVIRFYRAR